MTDVNAGFAHADLAPGEILDRVEHGRGGASDDNFLDVLQPRIDDGPAFRRNCQIGGDDVAITFILALQLRIYLISDSLDHHDLSWGSRDVGSID